MRMIREHAEAIHIFPGEGTPDSLAPSRVPHNERWWGWYLPPRIPGEDPSRWEHFSTGATYEDALEEMTFYLKGEPLGHRCVLAAGIHPNGDQLDKPKRKRSARMPTALRRLIEVFRDGEELSAPQVSERVRQSYDIIRRQLHRLACNGHLLQRTEHYGGRHRYLFRLPVAKPVTGERPCLICGRRATGPRELCHSCYGVQRDRVQSKETTGMAAAPKERWNDNPR